jgi:hypothetical protein
MSPDRYKELVAAVGNMGGMSVPSYGQGMMQMGKGPVSAGWGMQHNDKGITGVTDNNTGSSFSGGTEHIQFGNPYKPVNPNGPSRDNSMIAAEYYASMPEGLSAMEQATWMNENPIENFVPNATAEETPTTPTQSMTPQEIVDKYFYGHGTPNETLQDTPAYINEGYDPTLNAQPDPNITTSDPSGNGDGFTFGGGSSNQGEGSQGGGNNPPIDPPNPNVDEWAGEFEQPNWNGGGDADFSSNYDPRGRSTPFLDAYIRSKQAATQEGPVTGMMREYME